MITITKEALFDLLQSKEAEFRWDYKDCLIQISYENTHEYREDYTEIHLTITKDNVINLLLNRFVETDEFTLKIEN